MGDEHATVPLDAASEAKDEPIQLAPRFREVRELGRGGMGRVIEAFDRELERAVAVKVSFGDSADARGRFDREIAITARLEHPSIVPVYDAARGPDGKPFYVMRIVDGVPLDQALRAAPTLDARLLRLPNLLAAADAVAHAHARGVIHRDLKPTNILVGRFGETFVIDWGLAKWLAEREPARASDSEAPRRRDSLQTVAGTVMGTPGFMPPEQWERADDVDERADVFALGACLYYLLTGALLPESFALDDARLREAPAELVAIIRRATAREPRDRYLDAGGFGEELRRFLGGQLIAAHRYSTGQRARRWLRRHRTLVVAVVTGLIVTSAIGGVALRRVLLEREKAEAAAIRERERGDDLVLMQAESFATSDPTRAVATLRLLRADAPAWQRARPLLAEAHARGVTVAFPRRGHDLAHVDFAPTGRRFALAEDGVVALSDVDARTTRTLGAAGSEARVAWCTESRVVRWDGVAFSVVDVDTGRVTPLALDSATMPVCAGADLVVVTPRGALVASTLDGAVTAIDAGPYADVTASPTGAWVVATIATGGQRVFQRVGATWVQRFELPGRATAVLFSGDETRLVYAMAGDVAALALATGAQQHWAVTGVLALAVAVDQVTVLRDTGQVVALLGDGTQAPRGTCTQNEGHSLAGDEQWLVMLATARDIVLRASGARFTLHAPEDVHQVYLRGSLVVGLATDHVLVWDLRSIVPETAPVPPAAQLALDEADRPLVLQTTADSAHAVMRYAALGTPFALRGGETLARLAAFDAVAMRADGVVVSSTIGSNRLELRVPRVAETRAPITVVTGESPTVVALGLEDGSVVRVAATSTVLDTLPARVDLLAARGGWLAAQASDGTLWRRAPDGTMARRPAPLGNLAVTDTGEVFLAVKGEVQAWRGTALLPIAHQATAVTALYPLADGWLGLADAQGGLVLVNPHTGARVTAFVRTDQLVSGADGSTIAATLGERLMIFDVRTQQGFTLADEVTVGAGCLAVSRDGRSVLAAACFDEPGVAYRFRVEPMSTLRAWAANATNAVPPLDSRQGLRFELPEGPR